MQRTSTPKRTFNQLVGVYYRSSRYFAVTSILASSPFSVPLLAWSSSPSSGKSCCSVSTPLHPAFRSRFAKGPWSGCVSWSRSRRAYSPDRVECSTCAPLGEVFGYPYRRTTCCFLYDLAQDVPDSFGADSSDGFADSDRSGNPDSIASGAARSGGRRPLTHGE